MNRDEEIAELRRRLAALEAVPSPESTSAVPNNKPVEKARGISKGPVIVACGIAVIAALIFTSTKSKQPQTVDESLTDRPALAQASPVSEIPKTPWTYTELDDPMATTKGLAACTTSKNEVKLDFPYKSVTADLCIRKLPRSGLNIFVRLNGDGQILCTSYDGCNVLVRHDESPPRRLSAAGSADNSSNIIFFNGEAKLLDGLRTSKITRVELNLYQAGQQTIEFSTADLQWPPKVSSEHPAGQGTQ